MGLVSRATDILRGDTERIYLIPQKEKEQIEWKKHIPNEIWNAFEYFKDSYFAFSSYLQLRCVMMPLLLMNPDPSNKTLHELFLYADLMFLLEREISPFLSPEELPDLCKEAIGYWLEKGGSIEPFLEESKEEYKFVHLVPLPTDIYLESTGEADVLLSEIHAFNKCPSEELAKNILNICFNFKTIHPRDKERLFCFLIQKPNLHPHILLREQVGGCFQLIPVAKIEEVNLQAENQEEIEKLKNTMLETLSIPKLKTEIDCPKVFFEPFKPSLNLRHGCYESYLTVVLNIFTGKVTAHADLIHWQKQKALSLHSIADLIWRQIKNSSLEIKGDERQVLAQLTSDLKILLNEFGADEVLNLQTMDPHTFTLESIREFVVERFTLCDGIDPDIVGSSICQTLLGVIALSRPMDTQVLGIGADHDGSVTHCHTGNARFYRVYIASKTTQRDFDERVKRYAEFLQGPLQSTMNANQAIKPEITAALFFGEHLNLSFNQSQLEDMLYQTIVAEVASDLLPHSLDLFSHISSKKHKQYSKVIVEGKERLIESERGCFRADGKAVPYAIFPGTIQPTPFNTPSSEACVSIGMFTNPINPMDHRSFQHGLLSGLPTYEKDPFNFRIQRDPKGKGQTIAINRQRQYELKGFIPNNLVRKMTGVSLSCSSFVFLMLQTAYLATHGEGFMQDMDAIRAQFLPKASFNGLSIDFQSSYETERRKFQQAAVDLIEMIWAKSNSEQGVSDKYQQEILPYLIASKKGDRLSRPELCKIRTLSQLHCLHSESEIDSLGQLINWFFPPATETTAITMKALMTAAFQHLKKTKPYQRLLKSIKENFDISPMNTSPGLLLDFFEKEKMRQNSQRLIVPHHLWNLSSLFSESLKTSRFDPYGYQTDPSRIRAVAIDVGPKSVGTLRRIIQACLTPIHLLSQVIYPKSYNRNILINNASKITPKHVCFVAEAPQPSRRSESIEDFERQIFNQLCDLMENKIEIDACYDAFKNELKLDAYPEKALKIHSHLEKLKNWKRKLIQHFPFEKKLNKAIAEINFRTITEQSLQESIAKEKKNLQDDRKQLYFFEQLIEETVDLLRETMLLLKTIFLDLHAELCIPSDSDDGESTRHRIYRQEKILKEDIRKHRLESFEEWNYKYQLPIYLKDHYQVFYDRFNEAIKLYENENAIFAMIEALNQLLDALKKSSPSLNPIDVLDYPLLQVTLLLLDHLAAGSTLLEPCLQNPAIAEWIHNLVSQPPRDFIHFLEFIEGHNSQKKLDILKRADIIV